MTHLLLAELTPAGHWEGELSSSALSTAVATIALREMDLRGEENLHRGLVRGGLEWLARHANGDGGWGDTIGSRSNISTTALCWSAFRACDVDEEFRSVIARAEEWLTKAAGSLERLPVAIVERYGKDRTFSVPILMTLAISGRWGANRQAVQMEQAQRELRPAHGWDGIPALPFELAIFSRRLFGALKLPVVSYALPALIAIGQAIHHHAPSRNPVVRAIRNWSRARTLKLLGELQPANGGFLEATPLTAFVTMALACAGNHQYPVALKAAEFLRASVREDGSWPIDTNLATWVTTLSVKALARQEGMFFEFRKGEGESEVGEAQVDGIDPKGQRTAAAQDAGARMGVSVEKLREWLLAQQTRAIHPYTCAAPGAWAWSDLPGGVPDADDTAGALIALHALGEPDARTIRAAEAGVTWLLDLANRDGGIPTFCPGWGTLPFDRSTPEITAHALRAWARWRPHLSPRLQSRIDGATAKAIRFLQSNQGRDGSFVPLWFGNEAAVDEANPVYGTAQVLIAVPDLVGTGVEVPAGMVARAVKFLAQSQKPSGGWGGDKQTPESIEETALVIEALCGMSMHEQLVRRGTKRLLEMLERDEWKEPAPIGLYFARLWYYERLYPLIFSVSALGKVQSDER